MRTGVIGWATRTAASAFAVYIILALVLLFLIGRHLGAQPGGLSASELASQHSSASLSQIINHPINAPHNLLANGLHSLKFSWRTSLRLSSVLYGLVFVWSFYTIARSWFGKYIGLMGSLLLITTPLILVLARLGSAEIMYLGVLPIMAAYTWLLRSEKPSVALTSLVISSALMLYTPGILWFLAGGLIVARKKLAAAIELAEPPTVVAAILVGLLILVPLITALVKDWTIIRTLVLIPVHFVAPLTVLKEIAWMGIALFIRAPYDTLWTVGRLPVLSVIETALLVFGAYALWVAARGKVILFFIAIAGAVVVAGINNNLSLVALAVPFIAIVIAAGLRYLYIEWRSIFPRNPLARSLALSLMAIVVAVQLLFGVRYAIVAWPQTNSVKNTYVLK